MDQICSKYTFVTRKIGQASFFSLMQYSLFPTKPLPLCKPLRFVQFDQESCPAGGITFLGKLRAADES